MTILLSTGSVHHLDPELGFWLARMAKFDGVELLIDERWAALGPEQISRHAQRYQVPVTTIHAPLRPMSGWGDFWGNARQSLTWAGRLGVGLVTVHPEGRWGWFGGRARLARRLTGLRDAAAAEGMVIALENLPRSGNPLARWSGLLGRFEEVLAMVRECGVRLTLDTAHLGTWRGKPVRAFRAARDVLANIHLSDQDGRRQHLVPRAGSLPLDDLLTAAQQAGYAGPITFEARPEALGHGEADTVLPALIKVRKWIKRHSGRGRAGASNGQ